MYAFTLRLPGNRDTYQILHRAVVETVAEVGGDEGLLLHLAREVDGGGVELVEVWETMEQSDHFDAVVFPQALARAGVPLDGPPPQPAVFDPLVLETPRVFSSEVSV